MFYRALSSVCRVCVSIMSDVILAWQLIVACKQRLGLIGAEINSLYLLPGILS